MVQLAVQVFCKEVVRYHLPVLMNQLLSSHHFTFYLDIDKVKSYMESINTMLQDSYDSEELLWGL